MRKMIQKQRLLVALLLLILAATMEIKAAPCCRPKLPNVVNAADGVRITWPAVDGAERYRVFRKNGSAGKWSKVADTTSLSVKDTRVVSGTTYYYTIRCINATATAYTSGYNPAGREITYIDAPGAPVLKNAAGGVHIRWSAVNGAEKYRIYRKTGSGSWAKLADTREVTYTDTTAVSGTMYAYTIRCMRNDAGKTYTSTYHATGRVIRCLDVPLVSAIVSGKKIALTWQKVRGASYYDVYRRNSSGVWEKITLVTDNKYTDSSLLEKNTYSYTVRAVNGRYLSMYKEKKILFDPRAYSFSGKTAAFFGDSLTEVNYQYHKGYHKWIQELVGLKGYQNFGVSGYTLRDICNTLRNSNTNADVIFIMGGTNDQTFDVPFGTLEDTGTDTICGSIYQICKVLKEKYADRKIIFITPHYQTAFPHSMGITYTQIGEALKTICGRYQYSVYDNGALCGINRGTLAAMTNDGCHWNDVAHEKIGRQIAAWLLGK